MGQHNMLQFRSGQVDTVSRQLGDLFKMLGLGEWWDRRYYSCTIIVPEEVMEPGPYGTRVRCVQRHRASKLVGSLIEALVNG